MNPWTGKASRAVKVVALSSVAALALTGCELSVYNLPLPGGPDAGENPLEITVEFADVLDLVPQSTVKVNDVSVGKVTEIDLEGYHALVTLEVRNDVELPANAVAELRQTSLLGEKFVSLAAPESGASSDLLEDGDQITLEQSGRNPEVEEVLGALSLLLNGGGVAQLQTINKELSAALEGREGAARSVFRQIREFMGQLDANKEDIVAAIEALNRLAISAEAQLPTIDAALEELPSALLSVDRQRDDLVAMLRSLNELSDVAVGVIRKSKAGTIESLELLSPVLSQLAASGDNFVKAFHVFLTFPFVDETVGRDPQVARNLHMGDFTNLSVTVDVDASGDGGEDPLEELPDEINPTVILDRVARCLQSGDPDSRACRQVLRTPEDLLELRDRCRLEKNRDREVCKELNKVSLPGDGTPVLPDLPGLGRAGFDSRELRGPTYGELIDAYDPALVSLLVPGMVIQ